MLGFRAGWAAPVLALLGLAACTDLPQVQENQCGNGVVEPDSGEDCDQVEAAKSGNACGQQKDGPKACRWTCTTDGTIACPAGGWRCGVDGICRYPTTPATWSTALQFAGEPARQLLAADLDEDGVSDLVSVAPPVIDVRYFDAARTATPGAEIIADDPRPSVGSFLVDGADTPALSMDISYGLGTFIGGTDRSLVPTSYASATVDVQAVGVTLAPYQPYDPNTPGVPTLPTGFFAYNDTWVYAFTPPLTTKKNEVFFAMDMDGTRSGEGVVAWFDHTRPCQQIALAFNDASGQGHVSIFSPCDVNGDPPLTKTRTITLPPQSPPGPRGVTKLGQPLFLVDADGDKYADLAIVGDDNRVYVAYGDGYGHFKSTPTAVTADDVAGAGPTIPVPGAPALAQWPLAIADLNHDCALDFVLPAGVFVSYGIGQQSCGGGAQSPKGYYTASTVEDPHAWTIARVADLNRDGLPDVVAASGVSPNIDVYLGTGTQLFNPAQIITSAPTRALGVGDLDGDLVDDVAFAEVGEADPDAKSRRDTVYVAFGAQQGAPTAAQAIGQVGAVTQILPSYESAIHPDLIADLFVATRDDMDAKAPTNVYVFPGETSRQLDAPYYFIQPGMGATDSPDGPRRSLIGAFSGPGHHDIAVFGRPGGCGDSCLSRIWLVPTGPDASITPLNAGTGDVPQVTDLPTHFQKAEDALLADLGATGAMQPDVLAIAAPQNSTAPTAATTGCTPGSTWLATLKPTKDGFPPITDTDSHELKSFSITDGQVIAGQMITARVVSKDSVDLVLVSPCDGVAVVSLGADGQPDADHPRTLSRDALKNANCGYTPPPGFVRPSAGVAALRADDDTGRQALVVTNPGGTYLVTYDGTNLVPGCIAGSEGGFAVASGDFDGDGIEDIVVSERTGLTVYYGDAYDPGHAPAATASEGGAP